MNRENKTLVIILTLVLSIVLIYAAASMIFLNQQTKKTGTDPIRIGHVIWIGHGPLYIAKEKGFFKKEGVDVELIQLDTSVWSSALMSKSIDATIAPSDRLQIFNDAGIEIVAVVQMDESFGADGILATKNIQSIRELRGKKIAFEPGTPSHFLLLYLLDKENLTSKDIEPISLSVPDAGSAFFSGNVNVSVTWEPWLSAGAKREGGHILITTKETPGVINGLLVFRKDVVRERPEEVKAIIRAYFDSIEYYNQNPQESNEIIAKAFGLTTEETEKELAGLRWYDYKENIEYFGNTSGLNSVYAVTNKAGDLWLKEGIIKRKMKLNESINSTFLEELYD